MAGITVAGIMGGTTVDIMVDTGAGTTADTTVGTGADTTIMADIGAMATEGPRLRLRIRLLVLTTPTTVDTRTGSKNGRYLAENQPLHLLNSSGEAKKRNATGRTKLGAAGRVSFCAPTTCKKYLVAA